MDVPVWFSNTKEPITMINKTLKKSFIIILLAVFLFPTIVSATDWNQGSNWIMGSNWSTPALPTFNITSSNDTHSTISPSGVTSCTQGTNQSFSYAPSAGYYISSVLVDGSPVSITGSYTFTNIQTTHNITVATTIMTYTIIPSADAHSAISPSGTATKNYGTSQTYTYTANTGYAITAVYVDGVPVTITGSYTFNNIQANHTISVSTSLNSYSILATAGSGGTISPSGTSIVGYGGSVNFTFAPTLGYSISSVVVDNVPIGIVNFYLFSNVQASHTIAVYFSINTFTITASNDANCLIAPSGNVIVNFGDSMTFYYSSNIGYEITGVIIDSVITSVSTPTGSYTFTNVNSNHTISIISSASTAPTVTPTPTPYVPVRSTKTLNLYMRTDTFITCGVSGYGLSQDYNNTATTLTATVPSIANVSYGFRVYLITSAAQQIELTNGYPNAIVTLTQNYTGYITSTWTCPSIPVTVGYQALKVVLYTSIDNKVSWTSQAIFVTDVLISDHLIASSWIFTLDATMTQTTTTEATITFGNADHPSKISGVVIQNPLETSISLWRLANGDLIGFILGSYMDLIGTGLYAFVLFGICASLYRRYGHFGPVLVFFLLFAGTGGILLLFIPTWAIGPVAIIMIVGCAFILWRIIR
jgi:hypothetical protein